MAVLPDEDRRRVWAHFMRSFFDPISITKPELRAAINGLDDFIDSNATQLNVAIPQPARSNLSASQKAILLGLVAFRRAGLLRTQEDG